MPESIQKHTVNIYPFTAYTIYMQLLLLWALELIKINSLISSDINLVVRQTRIPRPPAVRTSAAYSYPDLKPVISIHGKQL